MDPRDDRPATPRGPRGYRAPALLLPLALVVAITLADALTPAVHLGPLLVAAPAITASLAGPWATALMGVLAVAGQLVVAAQDRSLGTLNTQAQILALIVVSALVVLFCRLREHSRQELVRVRSVSEAAQQVLMRPLPTRMGPLRLASFYLAAEDEAQIGGDLYAAVRTAHHAGHGARLLIGDVRGKGLSSLSDTAVVLGAFRESAPRLSGLPEMVAYLEESVSRHLAEASADGAADRDEQFVTALLADIPDDEPVVRLVSCGHPPPLLVRQGAATALESRWPGPPLGLGALAPSEACVETFRFERGDLLLLHTDGIIEARDRAGVFYPLSERTASWVGCAREADPGAFLGRLRGDLLAHVDGRLDDDAAGVAVIRASAPPAGTAAAGVRRTAGARTTDVP